MSRLTVREETRGEAVVLYVEGRFVAEQADTLRKFLERAWRGRVSRIVVEFSRCSYIDTGGIALLVTTLKRTREAGKEFYLASLTPQVQGVLKLINLDQLFHIRDTVEAALGK